MNNKFIEGLSYDQINGIFMQFDLDKDYKISYFEFSKHVLNADAIDYKKLLSKLKKQFLNSSKNPLDIFQSMDKDKNGEISFLEFNQALKNNKLEMDAAELNQLFRYFDKEGTDHISYPHFLEVLNEDHLNLGPLREKVFKLLEEKKYSIEVHYFFSYN